MSNRTKQKCAKDVSASIGWELHRERVDKNKKHVDCGQEDKNVGTWLVDIEKKNRANLLETTGLNLNKFINENTNF